MRKTGTILFLAASTVLLTACGGPSESDLKAAVTKQYMDQMAASANVAGLFGGSNAKAAFKANESDVKKVTKIGCKEDGENAVVCDFTVEMAVGDQASKPITTKGRFVKVDGNWVASR